VVWLRRDLRLADNPALVEAARTGVPVMPLALWPQAAVGAGRWWLARSLAALDDDLRRLGAPLAVRRGEHAEEVAAFAARAGARRVAWARGVDPPQRSDDERLRHALSGTGIEPVLVPSAALLVAPDAVSTTQGGPYQVFTPFWRAVTAGLRPPAPVPAPRGLEPAGGAGRAARAAAGPPGELEPAELVRETSPSWSAGFGDVWQPGEAGARARLERLLDDVLPAYGDDRDRVDLEGTSRLSPHLHWGELSANQVWHAVAGRLAEAGLEAEAAIAHPSGQVEADARPASERGVRGDPAAATGALARGAGALLRQLGWREFAHHLLWHFPRTADRPLREQFASFPWRDAPDDLAAWQQGRTGYPLVDAAMRCLWATGWMHNRARLVAGSFLVKDLLLPWQAGAAWFRDTLVDADEANNTLGWQWVAGCGADAAPYFRIFNPVAQGRRFDPDGSFVRRWLPELATLPTEWIHEPWRAPADALTAAGVWLGETYPTPIVVHSEARSRALAAYEVVKLAR
jgi:deoxyribodipyrimidine photo-lyase